MISAALNGNIIVTATAEAIATVITDLRALLGERLSTGAAVRGHHGKDLSHHEAALPDAVAFPGTTEEVAAIVRICAAHRVPVIAYGTGTSLEGHINAIEGGICIDLGGLNRILKVNTADLDVTVEAGVTRMDLNAHIRDSGLFFPIDPGANASLGGMCATRASGTNAVRYGTMRENVLALTVVLADGRIIRTARRARKSAAGYDLTRLFVGSEGTLGIITEATLRLYGIPEAMSSAVVGFDSLEGAVNTVITTIQSGIPIARIELLNSAMIAAINSYSKLSYAERPTLFLEFHGSPAGVAEQAENFGAIAQDCGGGDFAWTTKTEDRTRLWQARHDVAYAAMNIRPGADMITTDVCVPISRLADCILETEADFKAEGFPIPIAGHVGDGNFHTILLYDHKDPDETKRAFALNDRMVMRALAMEGTCTGEHGIGQGKRDFLIAEHGEAVSVMRAIKTALDPDMIMNPGKILKP
ncbi:FAD-binding oxidoreductase [Govanella unica]|uniref:D-lactate dehydrogenase (cytochrome) n=1 Tax=Govanella unica TaxID=2975056 RepID=A0A9X3U0H9_9PROT|nr:FAD-linked oxidase C-terminal domain-containing protein [Govania unica]MDA5195100.1 FAD-binding protein [Govania unica]